MSTYRPTFYGIDRDIIEEATRKARQERRRVVREMVANLFGSIADRRDAERDECASLQRGTCAAHS